MIYLKIQGLILGKEKVKENDAIVYILTKNNGILKCYLKGIFRPQSKNLSLFEPGNFNRLFILTNFHKYQIISALPLKVTTNVFKQHPYLFIWTLKITKNLKLIETPKFLWFILTHLENYLRLNPRNFPYWFMFHVLRELGFGIDLYKCTICQRKIQYQAYYDRRKSLFCHFCRKENYLRIDKNEIEKARKVMDLIKIPKEVPDFLKKLILNYWRDCSFLV
jgi:recombinational DNA repair protein (RecF pathway)